MFDLLEGELVETLACEFQYSVKHGLQQNAKACLFNIRIHLDGLMQRYSKVIPEPEMTHLLESACVAYGEQRPDTPFVDTLIRHFEGYARSQGYKLKQDKDTAHLAEIQTLAFRGNGVNSFSHRDFTAMPEHIAINYLGERIKAPTATQDGTQGNSALMGGQGLEDASGDPEEQLDDVGMDGLENQSDEEISSLIDAILGLG